MSTSPHHHITTSAHHRITASPHQHITTSPHQHITTSAHQSSRNTTQIKVFSYIYQLFIKRILKIKTALMVSTEQMKTIIPNMNWGKAQAYLPHINTVLPNYGIDTELRKAHFLAQISHESGGLHYSEENLNYSAKALRDTFKKYFDSLEIAQAYERQPEKIANRVYANRMGNGDEASGDGWKYRGRGLIQLTGKENYQNFAKDHGIDCVNNPDIILDPQWALTSACWYWKKRDINKYADADDIHMVTKRVNGGNKGLLHRQHYLDAYKRLFALMEVGV